MKTSYIVCALFILSFVAGCNKEGLNSKIDTQLTAEMITKDYNTLWGWGYACYAEVKDGFSAIDNNLFAAVTDDAEQTTPTSDAQLFNNGSWNAFNNPDDIYDSAYTGIRNINIFLEKSADFVNFLSLNRDTLSDHQIQYKKDAQDVSWLRNEARVLRAYYYFELSKRYGGVPLVTKTLSLNDEIDDTRASYDEIINFIVSEIDAVKDSLQTDWKSFDVAKDGRITRGAALALKSRVLLYAASPLHNTSNDAAKWQAAAQAALDVIHLNQYTLDADYQNLFLADNTPNSNETIWAIRLGATNKMETQNYPIGTAGGNSGVTPSENLVSSYEYTATADPADPYANRDPRLSYTIVTNNSSWNGRTIQIWNGGTDGSSRPNSSKTGFYLKKFLSPNLNLIKAESKLRSWIVFRYAETLLNYAEAMNEAFGPDNDNGWGLSARQAVNSVRNRPGVEMPPVVASDQVEMRDKIKHERRIELAFEGHRYWDLLRWKDAEDVLNQPLKGITAINVNDVLTYTETRVEDRVFIAPKMYYYPIPQTEISKSAKLLQNPGW